MAKVDLVVGIGAEYKGKPAFNKANKDVLGLNSGVRSLAKAYIGLAGAQKAFRLGRESLKAFVADDKAARQLTQTVTNLGLAYEASNVENFIQGLEKTYAVADDLLRPSFARLIQVTQSVTASQDIMRTALNAAAGAGVGLDTAVTDLSQAYVGNLKGLKKYNLGLTNAELATMSFQQIQDKLNQTFTGQAALAADTYAGKMDALTIASGNAKEIIGRGLTDAITSAFGGGDINKATTNIEKMGQVVADIVAGLGTMVGFLGKIGSWSARNSNRAIAEREGRNRTPYDPMSAINPGLTPAFMKNLKDRQKADAAAAKRQKELAALAVKQTKAIKEQTALAKTKAVLDKSSMVMNMDLIQNTAALMGKVTQDETLRLKLQQAILLENAEQAGNLAQQLLSSQIAAMKLSSTNPLGGFSDSLNAALQAARQLRNELAMMGADKVPIPNITAPITPTSVMPTDIQKTPENPLGIPSFYGYSGFGQSFKPSAYPTEIVVSIDPSAAALGITSTVITNSANGNNNNYNSQQSFAGGRGL
jgi:hypothetical protein